MWRYHFSRSHWMAEVSYTEGCVFDSRRAHMAKMMNKHTSLCGYGCCRWPDGPGRAAENISWRREWDDYYKNEYDDLATISRIGVLI